MKWAVTKRRFRGNVGAAGMGVGYDFGIGKEIGPKSLWKKLQETEGGWEFYKCDGEYVFINHHIDGNGNSWGKSEVVLTYLNYSTIYDCLDRWLKKGKKKFEVWCDEEDFISCYNSDDIEAEKVKKIVEDYLIYSFPEEVIGIVIQRVTVGEGGNLICNNPYASPEHSLEWEHDDKEFRIMVQSPSWWYGGDYLPSEGGLVITIKE